MESKYKIVRTFSAGVFFGELESLKDKVGVVKNARRIWYWKGAASLSELAVRGVKYPAECKFPTPVSRITLTEVIEILDVTLDAEKSIMGVPEWKA